MAKKTFKDNPALAFISPVSEEASGHESWAAATNETRMGHPQPPKQRGMARNGEKYPRINMAFTPDNLAHIQLMARVEGISATEYVNRLITSDALDKREMVEQAKKFLKGGCENG